MSLVMITAKEYSKIRKACEKLPPAKGNYHRSDYVKNLLLTVLDYQNRRKTIEKAMEYFRNHHASKIKSHKTLQAALRAHPDNRKAAQFLWNNNHWVRVQQLRNLIEFFEQQGIRGHASLKNWIEKSNFETDFKGQVRGLGCAIYHWLAIRVGANTIKPDLHVHAFIKDAIGRKLNNNAVIEVLERVAQDLNRKAYELDWAIFENRTGVVERI
ncbi:MAG: hypothetical protein KF851_05540 [Pirellulaceae bacterium]|nr:hypothetical protein [Pirellulaceae bacterium]